MNEVRNKLGVYSRSQRKGKAKLLREKRGMSEKEKKKFVLKPRIIR